MFVSLRVDEHVCMGGGSVCHGGQKTMLDSSECSSRWLPYAWLAVRRLGSELQSSQLHSKPQQALLTPELSLQPPVHFGFSIL